MNETDYRPATWLPAIWTALSIGKRIVRAIILHSTPAPARAVAIPPITHGSCSAHYHIDELGRVTQHIRENDIAFHAVNPRKPEWSNAHTIGLTLERADDATEWPDVQLLAVAKLAAAIRIRYPGIPVLTHADISRKPDHIDDPAHFPLLELEVAIMREEDAQNRVPRLPA